MKIKQHQNKTKKLNEKKQQNYNQKIKTDSNNNSSKTHSLRIQQPSQKMLQIS